MNRPQNEPQANERAESPRAQQTEPRATEEMAGSQQTAGNVGGERVGSKVTVVTGRGGRLGRITGDESQSRRMTGPRT
ncbi:MAG: hypothetical protein L0338_20775, partial [Acidobacteria bacterium]|nr:hypothetical protein [Acidobacteriota bacterium]